MIYPEPHAKPKLIPVLKNNPLAADAPVAPESSRIVS
jgi:hypothetical protein